ncbi:MAG: hypothetical protein M5U19_04870 [Microthrixaceae bacterium]|nr:hypothetical protein [Microthrixaceae bacterium]
MNLIGDEAVAALRRAGFKVKTATIEAASDTAPGEPSPSHRPAAPGHRPDRRCGSRSPRGAPASKTPVPDLRGYGRNQAIEELQRLYFDVTTRVSKPPEGSLTPGGEPYSGGLVWRTTPGPGELSPDGTIVVDYAPEQAPSTTAAPTTTTTTSRRGGD